MAAYADDTSSSVTGKSLEEIINKLEEEADLVLRFMASNGLIANPSKTTFMVLNNKTINDIKAEVKVGEASIKQVPSAKLLGVKIEESQKWCKQISGKGGVVPALNQRLYLIKRLKNKLNPEKLHKVYGIW